METEDLCQGEAHCLRSDKPHGKSRQTKHLTGSRNGRNKKREEGREVTGWAEVGRQRQNNKSGDSGGIFTDDENKRFALCVSNVDGWQPSERSSDALQTHKIESEHHGDTKAGITTLCAFVCP